MPGWRKHLFLPMLALILPAWAAGQVTGPVSRSLVLPGVSCSEAQIEAGANPDTNQTHGITPPVQLRPFARPRLQALPLAGSDTTVIRFVVDTSGAVDPCSLRVLRESFPWWSESVAEVVLPAKFRPATSAGRAIRYVVTFRYRYQ